MPRGWRAIPADGKEADGRVPPPRRLLHVVGEAIRVFGRRRSMVRARDFNSFKGIFTKGHVSLTNISSSLILF